MITRGASIFQNLEDTIESLKLVKIYIYRVIDFVGAVL